MSNINDHARQFPPSQQTGKRILRRYKDNLNTDKPTSLDCLLLKKKQTKNPSLMFK